MLNKISHMEMFFCGFINRLDTVKTDLVDRLEELFKKSKKSGNKKQEIKKWSMLLWNICNNLK